MNLTALIREFRNADNPVLYLGAGVSRSAPSSIPLFSELMEAYLDAIDPTDGKILYKHAKNEADDVRERICELPIEAFFTDVKLVFGDKAFEPLDWMDGRRTNQAHKLLAALARDLHIKTILTPNFDCLLEQELADFFSIKNMKSYSERYGRDDLRLTVKVTSEKLPDYLDASKPAIFHLHGTSIKSRLEITLARTRTPFDHFDNENLARRLAGATVLVAGCSGDWDHDVIETLKWCDLKNAIWIVHTGGQEPDPAAFPEKWRHLFYQKSYAIKGNTTEILAKFAHKDYEIEEADDRLTEFRTHVKGAFARFDKMWKLYAVSNLINRIHYGDIALSILEELESECAPRSAATEEETEKRFLSAISGCDYLTLADGRRLTPEQFMVEYDALRNITNRFEARRWSIVVGRAKAIAMNHNRKVKQKKKQVTVFLKENVMKKLEEVISYDQIGLREMKYCESVAREWMLAYESLGIFYSEDGDGKSALESIDRAVRICTNEEDLLRLKVTRYNIVRNMKLGTLLGSNDAEMIEKLFAEQKSELKASEIGKLKAIATKCLQEGALEKAVNIYRAIAKKYPNDVEACLDYSNIMKACGNHEAALHELNRGLEIDPNNYKLLCNKGLVLNEIARQHEAIPVLKEALKANPKDAFTWNNLGNGYCATRQFKKALEAYDAAIRLKPDFSIAKNNRYNALKRMGKVLDKHHIFLR